MLLVGPGTFQGVVAASFSGQEYASVSSALAADVTVLQNGTAIDHVFLVAGVTHTWWNTNPLLVNPQVGDVIRVVIVGPAVLRVEWGNRLPTMDLVLV